VVLEVVVAMEIGEMAVKMVVLAMMQKMVIVAAVVAVVVEQTWEAPLQTRKARQDLPASSPWKSTEKTKETFFFTSGLSMPKRRGMVSRKGCPERGTHAAAK
jgi:hypothetical protein